MLSKRIPLIVLFFLMLARPYAQVNLQTGSATFSLPMFNWQDDRSRLSSTVALGYNSGNGLRASDVASDVGQGWNLVAGGAITRLQVGEPDDQQKHEGTNSQDISRYPAGILYATQALSSGCPVALTQYPIYKGQNVLYTRHNVTEEDKQLDYFSFQFNGKAGMFVLDVVNKVGRPIGDSKMKITFTTDLTQADNTVNGTRTTINSFTITDVDGLVYRFNQQGKTKVLHADFCDKGLSQPMTQPTFKGGHVYYQSGFDNSLLVNPWVTNTWYLASITDSLANRTITFNYDPTVFRNVDNPAGDDISYNQGDDYVIVSHKRSVSKNPILRSITYPDGHQVSFTDGNARFDLNGEAALGKVDISYKGRPISEYQLNTTYLIKNRYGTPITAEQKKLARLYLRSVRKIGVDLKEDSPPYFFDYFTSTGSTSDDDFVPPPFAYTKDIWGYYNGHNSLPWDNNSSQTIPLTSTPQQLSYDQLKGLCFLNQAVPAGQVILGSRRNYAQNGLLKQIIYPTGGTLSYTYDQNTGAFENTTLQTDLGGVHVSATSATDGGYSNGCNNPVVTHYNYTANGPGSESTLWGVETPVNQTVTYSHYNSEQKKYHWTISSAPFGECYWNYQFPGILSALEAVDLVGIQKFMQQYGTVLGIITIIGDVADVLNLIFVSTGVLAWVAVIVDIVAGLVTLGITCFAGDNSKDNTFTTFYNEDLNGANPLPAQFRRVEVVENNGEIGRTVETFTSKLDYALWVGADANKSDFSAKQRFAPWAYGLPLNDTVFDVHGNKIKVRNNYYSWGDQDCVAPAPPSGAAALPQSGLAAYKPRFISACPLKAWKAMGLPSLKCNVVKSTSQRSSDWDDPTKYNTNYTTSSEPGILTVDSYDMYTGRVELDSSIEKFFNTDDQSRVLQTTTSYKYNSVGNYEVHSISVKESNGNITTKYVTYTSDYTNTQNAALLKLLGANIVTLPVSHYTTVQGPTLTGAPTLQERVTEFGVLPNGDVKASDVIEQRFSNPTVISSYYSPDNANNSSIYKTIKTFTYDANDHLIGMKDEGGRTETNIYNYSDKYIIATVVNADAILDRPAYTSFETDDPDWLGGWTLSGSSGNTFSATAMTGSRSLQLASKVLSARLNTNKEYILSFWASSLLSIYPGTLLKSGPVINGFTYYEYDIRQGTDILTVSGNANIDELRLYPKMARMNTVTYDPLIGKTSECDENNRITYYEYDNLGRLRFVKDENHNTVKMYEYNTVSAAKQTGCPTTFSNNTVTEFFQKTNCSSGYQGNEISYTVPAGRYTSTISQQDADNQAETDLLTNGPTTANNTDPSTGCSLLYCNGPHSQTFSTTSCADGQVGGTYTYSVPVNKYCSIVPGEADQEALDEIAANGQATANSIPANCAISTDPDWVYTDGDQTMCISVNGTTHLFYRAVDINPNSPTYNHVQWMDVGPSSSCGTSGNIYAHLSYDNQYIDDYGQERADINVHLYADNAETEPIAVANLVINYTVTWDYNHLTGNGHTQPVNQDLNPISISAGAVVTAPAPGCDPNHGICPMYYYAYLLAAGNYIIQ